MPEYTVIYAQNVSVYGSILIEAKDDEDALDQAKDIDLCRETAVQDIAWDMPSDERFLSLVKDETDDFIAEDVYLSELDRPAKVTS